jgi:hypothetical protein
MNNNIGELIYNYLLFDDQIKFAEYLNDTYLMKKAFQNKYNQYILVKNNDEHIDFLSCIDLVGCKLCNIAHDFKNVTCIASCDQFWDDDDNHRPICIECFNKYNYKHKICSLKKCII